MPYLKVCGNRNCRIEFTALKPRTIFCTTRCRVAFNRAKEKPNAKPGLRPGQLAILRILAKVKCGGLTPTGIAEHMTKRAGLESEHCGQMSDYLGHITPEKRAKAEAKTGYPSLLTLGYVKEEFGVGATSRKHPTLVIVYERRIRCYEITEAGRRALADSK